MLASEQNRPDVARRRWQWRQRQSSIDPSRLVFIDETWTKTNMAPLRGWARRGVRLRDHAPHGHWRTLTLIAALRQDGITAPCLFDGPINGESFRAYVEQILLPTLREGDIVVMDNLGSHKSKAVREAIRSAGARRLFLPAYSPDSSRSSPSSRRCSEKPEHARARRSAMPLRRCFPPSPARNAQTIFSTQDMRPYKLNTL